MANNHADRKEAQEAKRKAHIKYVNDAQKRNLRAYKFCVANGIDFESGARIDLKALQAQLDDVQALIAEAVK